MTVQKKKVRKLIFRLTAKDFNWSYYKAPGKGGQKKNKTMSGVRCSHKASGAVGKCSESRMQGQNKKAAFRKMAETRKFQTWAKLDGLKKIGWMDRIEAEIDRSMKLVKVEVKDDRGRWVEVKGDL